MTVKAKLFSCALLTNLSFTGCMHSVESRLWGELRPWIGKHPDTLVETWGAPQASYVTSTGRKVLSFGKQILATTAFYDYYRPHGVFASSSACKINFFTNEKQDSINDVNYIGDSYTCLDLALSSRKTKQ
jgi:hypothetical protein